MYVFLLLFYHGKLKLLNIRQIYLLSTWKCPTLHWYLAWEYWDYKSIYLTYYLVNWSFIKISIYKHNNTTYTDTQLIRTLIVSSGFTFYPHTHKIPWLYFFPQNKTNTLKRNRHWSWRAIVVATLFTLQPTW